MTSTSQDRRDITPLPALLTLTFLASLGTGVVWSGIPFIAKQQYGYSETMNLLLSLFMGAIYTVSALLAGPVTRWVERWLSPRAVLAWVLIVLALVSLGPVVIKGHLVLWLIAAVTNVLYAFLWPIVESFLSSGRHGHAMRNAIGWFNMVWTSATAASMFYMAPMLESHAMLAIVGLAGTNALAALALLGFPRSPGSHDESQRQASISPEYPLLLRSARTLLPLSYLLAAAMTPLMPFRFSELQVDVFWQTPALATWQVVRVACMAIMWRVRFWHGRWGTLLLGAVTMTGGFALIVLGSSLWVVLLGLAVFGVGMGVIYYAALYYGLAVGSAAVDAGGKHEALIGAGYSAGPLAALLGMRIAAASGTVRADAAIVAVLWGVVALGGVPALVPYLQARRLRSESR
jgi:hypothetical protein